jgi:hypothetical protein
MSALVDIFNRALSACGAEIGITAPDENSREAALCRLWYPAVRDNVLAAAPWPSVRRYARLARLQERNFDAEWQTSDPSPRYRFAFALPSDLLQPYHLNSYRPFEIALRGASRTLSADEEHPILYYNMRVEDTSAWEPNLSLAVVHTLATYIAIPLTGRSSRLQENAELAFMMIEDAQTAAANASSEIEETLPDWLQARGYANPMISRYYYPMQTLAVARAT